ncbi:MAG: DMT family transporter [Candidatus Obscuribacterales bacterium]|nr:DMT family transporter [Candidatus Obscuribacterales bacterium]
MAPELQLNLSILVSLLLWGAWGIFDKLALKHAPANFVMLCLFALSLPIGAIVLVLLQLYNPGWSLTPEVFFWTGLGCASYMIAMSCYLRAMNISEASFVLGATASYPIILQFLSSMFLHEALVPARIVGSLLVSVGVGAIGASGNTEPASDQPKKRSPKLFLLVVGATLLWGIWGLFDKKAVSVQGPLVAFMAHCIWELIVLVPLSFIVLRENRQQLKLGKEFWGPLCASGFCINVGGLSYMLALSMATASYVVVITGCYPLIMYLLAILILKEKFNLKRLAGIVFVTMGGIITHTTEGL